MGVPRFVGIDQPEGKLMNFKRAMKEYLWLNENYPDYVSEEVVQLVENIYLIENPHYDIRVYCPSNAHAETYEITGDDQEIDLVDFHGTLILNFEGLFYDGNASDNVTVYCEKGAERVYAKIDNIMVYDSDTGKNDHWIKLEVKGYNSDGDKENNHFKITDKQTAVSYADGWNLDRLIIKCFEDGTFEITVEGEDLLEPSMTFTNEDFGLDWGDEAVFGEVSIINYSDFTGDLETKVKKQFDELDYEEVKV